MTWTLRTQQMTGLEIFSMDGEDRFMKAVYFGREFPGAGPEKKKKNKAKTTLRRVK